MEIVQINPNELRAHWPTVSKALDSVIESTYPDWIKEDVFFRLKTQGAYGYLIYEKGQYQSLFVISPDREEFSGLQSLHIWIAHNVGGDASYDFGLEQIKQIARNGGASRLTLESPRKGWGKRFKLVSATYEVPLA